MERIKPAFFGALENMEKLKRDNNRMLIQTNNKMVAEQKKIKNLNQRAWEREEEKIKLLKSLDENVQLIAREIKYIHLNLMSINEVISQSNYTKDEILDQLKEVKHIDAFIYEALLKHDISTEKGRIEASTNLSTNVKDGIDVVANLSTIIPSIFNVLNNIN